jgi:hypothetical protein
MKFDIDSARKAGYSDDEIADYLATENKFDLSGAIESGYTAREVIDFLSVPKGGKQDLPADVKPSEGRSATPMGKADPRLVSPAAEEKKPPPYKNRIEALDDAVNLVEEGADLGKVNEAFAKIGIKPNEIAAHGQKRGSEYFKQQPAQPTQAPQLPADYKPSGEIKAWEPTALEEVGNTVKRGVIRARQESDTLKFQTGAIDAATYAERTRESERRLGAAAPSGDVVEGLERLGKANESGSYAEVAKELLKPENWKATAALVAESAIPSMANLPYTVAGGLAAGPLGAAAAAGATSFASEYANALSDTLDKRGINKSDPIALRRAIEDPEVMDAAREYGIKRGIPVAAFDALSAGFAGRFLRTVERAASEAGKAATKSAVLGATAKEGALQVGAGMAGEFGGQQLTGENKPLDVIVEGLAELPGGASEVITNLHSAHRKQASDPAAAVAKAMNTEIANTEFAVPAREVAADLLNPNTYDQRLISPSETTKPGQVVNFTEPDSATAQAGLTPVVVPLPTAAPTETAAAVELPPANPSTEQEFGLDKLRMGGTNVSTTGASGSAPANGGIAGGTELGRGVDGSGLDVAGTAGRVGGGTGLSAAGAQSTVAAGGAIGEPASNLTAKNSIADTTLQPWAGRSKIGYSTEQDAEQARATASAVLDTKDTHDWRVERMDSGRYHLVPYFKETTLGNQTTQAVQAEAQGQEAPAGASAVAAPVAASTAPKLQDSGVPRLDLAPAASLRDFKIFQQAVKADGIEIAPVRMSELNDTHKLASVVARLLGKTYTVARVTSGDPTALSNGMVDKLGGKHIVAAENTEDAPLFVAMHEAYHGLPMQQRKALNAQLLQLFRTENKDRFLKEFNYDEAHFEEEAPAFMAQVISKREDFWEELRTKMGNKEFGEVAKVILGTLNQILRKVSGKYGQDFADTYITDIAKARDLLTTAYAEAMQAQGLQPDVEVDTGVMASNKGEDIGAKLQERVDNDFDALVKEYSALPGTDGGRKLDADIARELSPEYRADRSRAPEVHEAVSDFIEKLFTQRVQARKNGTVAFMAGGGGAGKSSAETLVSDKLSKAHTILDGTLSSPDKAARLISLVVANGQNAVVTYIYRDPVEAVTNGVLTRAMRTGRVVPIYSLVKTHSGASETVRMLQEAYGDDDRFKLFVVDNSRGPGNAALVDLSNITPVIKSGLKERLYEATQQAYDEGRISQAIYAATVAEGQPDTRAEAQTKADAGRDVQRDQGSVQGRSGSERAGNAVSKDEAVVDGVVYSSKRRNLVDIPTIELRDLVGKKVVGIKADLTDAGRSYTGIDGSQLEFPVEMMGGPNYVRLPENAKANVVWAVRGGATLTKIMSQVNKADYVLVHAMNGNSHLTNSTISTAYLQTVEAYLRDGRISKDNLKALDEIVRSPKNKSSLPDFPGFESPEIYSYIDGLSFDQRGALAQMLEKKEAQAHGLPNLERFRRETIDPDFAGYRQGDAMLVIKVDKENPTVKLGEDGTKMHPSYPLGLRGTVIGKLAKGVNYELIFRDYFKFAVPNFKNGEAGAWYAFDRKMPIQKITKEIAESVAPGGYSTIKTARQAEAALALANGNWLVSGKTKAQGGISVQEFVDALRANDGAAALTLYTADEVKAGIKDKSFTIYQLGKEGGDKGLQVFFGLKRGAPWYKDMIDGVSDNEVEVVSVTNNEAGAPGVGIPAIITKAIYEGATVLDAFAVKSARFPNGFLPEMYAQFGFEEIGRIPFDPSFYDANGLADLKAFWSRGGWREADGYPDVVVMRWKGNDEDRATAVERYVRSGATSVPGRDVVATRAAAADARGKRNGKGAGARGRLSADAGSTGGNQGAGDAASVVTRAFGSIQELATLGDGDIRNLGLDPAEVQRLRDGLAGVQRSNRSAELARGPGARSDEGTGRTVTGIHYGKAAGLSRLSGTAFGTGIKGAEQARLNEPGVDPRIKKRVYFYLTNNNADMPRPEIGLGSHVYRATLGNMFDMATATPQEKARVQALRKTGDANGFESAVLDAGFRGYVNREMQTAVVLNADVPVAYEGMADGSKMRDRVAERVAQAVTTRTEGDELVRRPSGDEMTGIIKARPALATAAPSFKLQFGEARVKASEAAEADRVLADAGAGFRFGEVMRSQRAFHGTHARGITKFSTEKIGTGEGNQSFGWGLYFASKRDIAEYYRRTLSEARSASLVYADGTPVPFLGTGMDTLAATWLAGHQGDYAEAEASIRASYDGDDLAALLNELKKLQDAGVKGAPESVGQLYEVDIPEDSEMLDWDKPLSEQPEYVAQQLRDVIEYEGAGEYFMRALNGEKSLAGMSTDKVTGEKLYKQLTNLLGSDKAASAALSSGGIKGIKYLDATSRGPSGGTSNYVVFSDDDVAIQEVYYSRRSNRVSDTPEFKRWFGDSKVVDAEGKPLVVYHGTATQFDAFDPRKVGSTMEVDDDGFFFTNDRDLADRYSDEASRVAKKRGQTPAPRTLATYVSLQNPWIIYVDTDKKSAIAHFEGGEGQFNRGSGYILQYARESGYDGVIIQDKRGLADHDALIIAFNPTQIKSATGNEGTFDPENPSILKSNRARESWFIGRDELGRPVLGAGAKAYRVAADLANNVLARVALKPISKDLSRAMRKMKMEIEQARLLTADAADHLSKLDENERAMISDVIEGELKRGVKPPKRVLEVAASMQGIMSEQTAELVRLGMLSADAAGRWDGKYLPRFYESKLMDEGKRWVKAAKAMLGRPRTMQGIKGSSLKGRGIFQTIPVEELESWLAEGWQERDPKFNPDTDTEITIWRDYTREERENMGEIRDAMFRFVMGYTKSQQDIALGRLYEQLANTVASKHEQEGYVQVPSTNVEDTKARRYGKLAGKWVPQEVMDHLSATDSSMQSDVMKFYLKALSMWKEGKTVLNPVSHANNVLSNLTVAHFAGVSYWDVHKYAGATRDLVKNSAMVQEARDAGLFGGTMTQAELVDMLPEQLKVLAARTESKAARGVEHVWNAMSFWLRKPLGKAYEAEDLFFRYLIYRDARQRGLEPDDAVEYAQKYIFTYDDLPKGARMVRNFALPFFSYTYKVIPMLAQTALETPWRYAAPAAALYTVNAMMYAFAAGAGEDDDDWMSIIKRYLTDPEFRAKAKGMEEDERKNLPSWMKGASLTLGTSKSIRLGVDEATDLPVFLDVSRMFPGGDLFDAQNNAGGVPLLAPITPNNPLLTAASAILFNKDSFTGKEIVKKTDTSSEAAAKRAEWAWRQFTPAIAVGNYHFDRAMNVLANVTGEPVNLGFREYTGVGKDGSPVQPGYAALQTVGIKARPIDLELSAKIDQSQTNAMIRDIDTQIRSLRRLNNKGAISDAAMEKETETLREKRQRLKEGLTVDGEEK